MRFELAVQCSSFHFGVSIHRTKMVNYLDTLSWTRMRHFFKSSIGISTGKPQPWYNSFSFRVFLRSVSSSSIGTLSNAYGVWCFRVSLKNEFSGKLSPSINPPSNIHERRLTFSRFLKIWVFGKHDFRIWAFQVILLALDVSIKALDVKATGRL